MSKNTLKIGLAQISPVWLDKERTIKKVRKYIQKAGKKECDLIVFGEALLPGYPYWVALTNGAKFDDEVQKEIFAHYAQNAVHINDEDLNDICLTAAKYKIAVYLGTIERAFDRGGHSLYCSLVYIDQHGQIRSVHRKLQPTYEERLVWSQGDGNGIKVHPLKNFTLGGLNCWENWMPLSRTALYAMGEDVHIAVWPGSKRNTKDITKFVARESRSFVISVSGYMTKEDIPKDFPHREKIIKKAPEVLGDGGSCIAGPDGNWILKPQCNKEGLFVKKIRFEEVLKERQNFDPAGHYSRPEVTKLNINRERQSILFEEGE